MTIILSNKKGDRVHPKLSCQSYRLMKSSKALYLYGVACYVEKDITLLDRFQRATPSLVGSMHHDQLSV